MTEDVRRFSPSIDLSGRVSAERASRPMRVLVLHQHYWPEIAATAQILTDLCEDLAAKGHEVRVVCGQPSYHGKGKPLPSAECHNGVQVRRVWSHLPSSRTIPRRLLQYGTYFGSSLAEALIGPRPDVCFVMSTPPLLLGVSGVLLSRLKGVPFVYSVQDLYPDIAIHLGVIPANGVAARAIDASASLCYRSAASLVTLSKGMAERLLAKGVSSSRVHVIANWADTSAVVPAERDNDFARAHGLADGFVAMYSGNLGLSQGLESLLAAVERVDDLPITVALVGDGNAREALEREAQRRRLTKVRFLPPQPRSALSKLLSSSDVGLVTMKSGVGADLVPSKLYGIMAVGRPVLASVDTSSEVARVIEAHRAGWIVAPESPDAMAEGLRRAFLASADERATRGNAGRVACATHYSRSALTTRYEQVLREAAQLPSAGLQAEQPWV